ncbi:MAG TPA: cytochrome c family protein [Caulobacteraceae bacterium]|jgi:cytochrome c|nr:cytochrome c family protein [Caulobacteraceae bacterium]
MADSLMFNKIAGATLATGLLIFGLSNAMGIIFEQAPPTKPGYAIAVQEETEGAAPADVPPDWGTVLPKANIAAGQAITSKCQSCHSFDPAGTNEIGPGLFGVVGRQPGTHPGYSYDEAMNTWDKTHSAWTYDLLYQFLKSPGSFMPGTKMTFVGLPDPQDRINVIAYLHSNGSPNYPIPAPKPAAAPSAGGPNPAGAGPATAPAAGAAKSPSTPTTTGAPTNAASEAAHTSPPG